MLDIRYAIAYLFPMISFWALTVGGAQVWIIPFVTFVIIPLAEVFFVGTTENSPEKEIKEGSKHGFYNWLLYGMLPLQLALIVYLAHQVGSGFLDGSILVGAVFTVGICCGAFGINIGHELGHRNDQKEQLIAKGLLLSSLYMHFFIEHNRGHHLRVATPEDPATSQYNSMVFSFWWKSISKGYLSAWALEKRRLERRKLPAFHWKNEMIWYQVVQGSCVLMIWFFFGVQAMLSFMAAALIGILLLETINYIEHYGLERNHRSNGKYERVQPHHSWNSNHPIGRALLFELTRHSDHHAHANRHYTTLRHFEGSPQLPYGYPAMIVIALFPPLWFSIMNPHVEKELNRLERLAA